MATSSTKKAPQSNPGKPKPANAAAAVAKTRPSSHKTGFPATTQEPRGNTPAAPARRSKREARGSVKATTAKRTPLRPPGARAGELRLAAIDIGTNSLHMIVAQADSDGGMTTLWRIKEMVGLGRLSFPSRRLSLTAMDAAVSSLRRLQQAAISRGCEKIIGVATSAVREAENGGDFLERVRLETGLAVRIISAREEARLIHLGVQHAAGFTRHPNSCIDIGGGSVEFIVADEHRTLLLESRKLGAARMTARFVRTDPVAPADLDALRKHYDRELTPLCRRIATHKCVEAVGSSGTIENLYAMTASAKGSKTDQIAIGALDALVASLEPSTSGQRSRIKGLDPKRQDQVLAGAVLLQTYMKQLGVKQLRVIRSALREGVVLDYIHRHMPELKVRRDVPDVRRRSVLDLARRCDWHRHHSEHVTSLTLGLFDQTCKLHKLGKSERELIEYGAMLHDIGWHIAKSAHHKHSLYLILNGGLQGFTDEQIKIVANIARYHRKSPPKAVHIDYTTLGTGARKVVRVGASMVRIADGLDRSHASVVTGVNVEVGRKDVVIRVRSRGDCELELWAGRQKRDMFQEEFGRSVQLIAETL